MKKVIVIFPKLWTSVTVHRAFTKISSSNPPSPESKYMIVQEALFEYVFDWKIQLK